VISGLLSILGIDMGEKKDEASQEDLAFLIHGGRRDIFSNLWERPRRQDYIAKIAAYVKHRNSTSRWGWKDPISYLYLKKIAPLLRNPCYIVVMRDPVAVAQRERLSEGSDSAEAYISYLYQTIKAYEAIVLEVNSRRNVLFVSYEKSLLFPRAAAEEIAQFLRIEMSTDQLRTAIRYVVPNRRDGRLPVLRIHAPNAALPSSQFLLEAEKQIRLEISERSFAVQNLEAQPKTLYDIENTARRALDAFNSNDLSAAQRLAEESISSLAVLSPLSGFPPAVAEGLLSSGKLQVASEHAAAFIIANFALGMSLLQSSNPESAISNFSLCYAVAAQALLTGAATEWPGKLIWPSLFHKALSAKLIGSAPVLAASLENLRAHKVSLLASASKNEDELKMLLRRAELELE
jgi:Sulfotransferase family